MIAFTCAGCGKSLKVKDDFAGKRGACPHCKNPVIVPALEATIDAPQADDTPSSQEVDGAKLDFLAPARKPGELGWLGRYRVLKVLGAGGMGLVLQAEDPLLKRAIALKIMRPELAANEVQRKRFLREAQATAAVEHDHIIAIHEVGVAGQVPFIAMPFLKGEPLDQRLKREAKLPPAEAARIARQTAEGLAGAHERGLIHRDIKPGNIWLEGPKGRVKIMDFGLARGTEKDDVHLTKSGAIVGTPAYMAPEQGMGKPVDFRCDLFSLGAVLYRMLSGELPFKGQDTMSMLMALATEDPKPIRELNADVPVPLSGLVMQLLAKDPAQRPASASAVAEQLAAIEEDTGQFSHTTSESTKPRDRIGIPSAGAPGAVLPIGLRIGGRTRLAITGTLCLLFGLLVFLLWPKSSPEPVAPTGLTKPAEPEKGFTNALGMEFVLIPKGRSWLGGDAGKPGVETELPCDFYLGKHEVTQEEWEKVMGHNPSNHKELPEATKRLPVENVSWKDCQSFLWRVNEKTKEAGWVYRLPKEVEWEYACRGGPMKDRVESSFDYYLEKPSDQLLSSQANINSDLKQTCKVGSYKPNRLGLYDMHGNVWEWCDDPEKPGDQASNRLIRGGAWNNDSTMNRAASRLPWTSPSNNLGLRLARVPSGKDNQ